MMDGSLVTMPSGNRICSMFFPGVFFVFFRHGVGLHECNYAIIQLCNIDRIQGPDESITSP